MYFSKSFIKAGDELCSFEKHINATYFRRKFSIDFLPDRSEITICGLEFYELYINGVPGQKVTIRHAEYLVDGEFDMQTTMFLTPERRKIYNEYGQCDVYICRGGDEMFIPRFKYDGFRYAYVEGLLPEQINDDTLICVEMTSNLKQRASFVSSNYTISRLQQMTEQADRSNFFCFSTDCPHREKNGWTGDASLSAEQLLLKLDSSKSLKEWLKSIKKTQDGASNGETVRCGMLSLSICHIIFINMKAIYLLFRRMPI